MLVHHWRGCFKAGQFIFFIILSRHHFKVITYGWQNHSVVLNKYVSQSLFHTLQTTKTNRSCARGSFSAVLFILCFNVLSGYFCFTQFDGSFHCLNFDKFLDLAPLSQFQSVRCRFWPQKNTPERSAYIG